MKIWAQFWKLWSVKVILLVKLWAFFSWFLELTWFIAPSSGQKYNQNFWKITENPKILKNINKNFSRNPKKNLQNPEHPKIPKNMENTKSPKKGPKRPKVPKKLPKNPKMFPKSLNDDIIAIHPVPAAAPAILVPKSAQTPKICTILQKYPKSN